MPPPPDDALPVLAVVEAKLARIGETNDALHAFAAVDRSGARVAAAAIDQRIRAGEPVGSLAGVTIAVKDVIAVHGLPLTCGSRAYRENVAGSDAAVVERLRQAGAVVLGTTTCHELAYGLTGDSTYPYAAVNPHVPGAVPGGSSSGSAVATAAHLTRGAVGSDTGGSVRIPAACCGVIGLKPTRGLVSTRGMYPLAPSLDHVGVFARSVRDVASMMDAIVGYNPGDEALPTVSAGSASTTTPAAPLTGTRIGLLRGHFDGILDAQVEATFRKTIEALLELGAEVSDVDVESAEDAMRAQRTTTAVEARHTHKARFGEAPDLFGVEVRRRLIGAEGISLAAYLDARRATSEFCEDLLATFDQFDVLTCPTLPILPPRVGRRRYGDVETPHVYDLLTRFTSPFNTAGVPAMSVPMGRSHEGLPMGIQLVARPFGEQTIYRVASVMESCLGEPEATDQ